MECVIEVCPRSGGDAYHACIQGTAMWGCGQSIEEAVVGCISTYHTELNLTADDLMTARESGTRHNLFFLPRRALINLVKRLSERGIEVDIRFLPIEIR